MFSPVLQDVMIYNHTSPTCLVRCFKLSLVSAQQTTASFEGLLLYSSIKWRLYFLVASFGRNPAERQTNIWRKQCSSRASWSLRCRYRERVIYHFYYVKLIRSSKIKNVNRKLKSSSSGYDALKQYNVYKWRLVQRNCFAKVSDDSRSHAALYYDLFLYMPHTGDSTAPCTDLWAGRYLWIKRQTVRDVFNIDSRFNS